MFIVFPFICASSSLSKAFFQLLQPKLFLFFFFLVYSQLDKGFLIDMSSPHIIEIDYVVRPPKLVIFPKSSRKDQEEEEEEEEEEKGMDQLSKVLHEGEDDNFTLHTPPPSPSPSSLSSSSQDGHGHGQQTVMRAVEVLYMKNVVRPGDVDDDDGYHTPTSPRHQIPAALECPPAPRRKSWQRQQQRRKRGRTVYLRLVAEVDGDDDHMLMAKAKKARE